MNVNISRAGNEKVDELFWPSRGKVLSCAVHEICLSYCRKVGGREMNEVIKNDDVHVSTPDADKSHNIKLANETSENVSSFILGKTITVTITRAMKLQTN